MNSKWTKEEKDWIRGLALYTQDSHMPYLIKERTGRSITLAAYIKLRQRLGVKKR